MIELWWHEADRNQVLPLFEGILTEQRAASFAPPPLPGPAGTTCTDPAAAPSSRARSSPAFASSPTSKCPDGIFASGVICAHHIYSFGATVPGGWACYVLDGRLIVTFDAAGVTTRVAVDDVGLAGRHAIGVAYLPEP